MRKTVLVLLVLMTSSCSLIFEDRSDCPCLLTIDYGNCNEYPIDSLTSLLIKDNDFVFRKSFHPPFTQIDTFVHKGAYVFSNWGNVVIDEKEGKVFPDSGGDLYSFCTILDCHQDLCHSEVRPIPEFARMTVRIIDKEAESRIQAEISGCNDGFGYQKEILSDSASFDLPLEKADSSEVGKTCLLRMKDVATLKIRLTKDGKSFVYPAGKILKEKGYDMSKERLDPIEIIIDTVLNEVTIKTQDWIQVEHTEISF